MAGGLAEPSTIRDHQTRSGGAAHGGISHNLVAGIWAISLPTAMISPMENQMALELYSGHGM